MSYTCSDVLRTCNEANHEITVLAGREGLSRAVNWVYVADATDSLLETLNWIVGGELVVCTGANIVGDAETVLIQYLIRGAQKGIAGIVINTGKWIREVPGMVIEKADELQIPIMVVPWETRFVAFTKLICTSIVQQMYDEGAVASYVSTLLNGVSPIAGTPSTPSFVQFLPTGRCTVAVFDYDSSSPSVHALSIPNHIQALLNIDSLHALVSEHDKHTVAIIQMPEDADYHRLLVSVLARLNEHAVDQPIVMGVGTVVQGVEEIKKSYETALRSLTAAKIEKCVAPFFAEEIGVYDILFALEKSPVLTQYFHALFDPLNGSTASNGGNLIPTLLAYFECGGSLSDTAKRLFVHENTLKYRLGKITALIGVDPRTLHGHVRIGIGIKIGKLLNLL